MEELKLPEPLKVNKNMAKLLDDLEKKGEDIFAIEGHDYVEIMMYLYLMKKYRTQCVPYHKHAPGMEPKLSLFLRLKKGLPQEQQKDMLHRFEAIATEVSNCVKKGDKIVVIPLCYYRGKGAHANMLIYRRKTNVIEHFEPHGGEYRDQGNVQDISKHFIGMFIKVLNNKFEKINVPPATYVEASDVCPYIHGLQTLEGKSKLKHSKAEPGGYCMAWSFFFAELCLKNPEMSSRDVLENIYNYLTTKKDDYDYLRKIIRGYTGYITETINRYLEIFFKPKITILDLLSEKHYSHRISKILKTLYILVELEMRILSDPDFDVKKELYRTKKYYKILTKKYTKNGTKAEQRKAHYSMGDYEYLHLYLYKRVLQNYEEYNNAGTISEPIFDTDSFENIPYKKQVNIGVKSQKFRERKSPNSPKSKTKTRKSTTSKVKKTQLVIASDDDSDN